MIEFKIAITALILCWVFQVFYLSSFAGDKPRDHKEAVQVMLGSVKLRPPSKWRYIWASMFAWSLLVAIVSALVGVWRYI